MDARDSNAAVSVTDEAKLAGTTLFDVLLNVATRANHDRRTAVVDGASSLTYADFVHLASEFAATLGSAGVRPRDRIAVILGNSREFLIAAFGTWKHGAVLVPLNPQLQETELLQCVSHSAVRVLITTVRNGQVAQTLRMKAPSVEHIWLIPSDGDRWIHLGAASSSSRGGTSSEAQLSSAAPAITQYSTGSTGHPKRVTRTHGALLGEFASVSNVLQVTSADRAVGAAPFFHSHGLMNCALLTLLSGGTLHVVNSFFAREVASLIGREGISVFAGVPFMFQHLANLEERHDFSRLRCVVSAGAPLPSETADAFAASYGLRICQLYGATETGVISIQRAHRPGDVPSVGLAIPGVAIEIVDDADRPVTAGVPGKVKVTSRFAARAYDDATGNNESYFAAESFFPGDIGRMSPQGELVLCGRYRGFIDVDGNKVDPTEIEAALLELPAVTEAVVFGIPDAVTGEKIKAVIVARSGTAHDEIRAHCVQRLAEFKHPRVIEFRSELPKSPLGKVLRKYLMDESSGERSGFDPRSYFGAAAALPASLQLSRLPPFLRVLLVTDGTVTRSMEAFFGEPIDVEVLSHVRLESDRPYPDLNVAVGEPITRRRVLLRGRTSRFVYAFAQSILPNAQLSQEMRRKLIEERKGIGELLRDDRLETFREITGVRRERANDLAPHLLVDADASVLVRSYKIYHAGRPIILVEEVFPESRF